MQNATQYVAKVIESIKNLLDFPQPLPIPAVVNHSETNPNKRTEA